DYGAMVAATDTRRTNGGGIRSSRTRQSDFLRKQATRLRYEGICPMKPSDLSLHRLPLVSDRRFEATLKGAVDKIVGAWLRAVQGWASLRMTGLGVSVHIYVTCGEHPGIGGRQFDRYL